MGDLTDPDALAERIDALLGELRGDARTSAVAENLVRTLMQFYGTAFARTLDLIALDARPVIDTLAADPLVGSVMLLHDLHPADRAQRVADAIERARALVDNPDASLSLMRFEADHLRLRLTGVSPSTMAASRNQILRTMRDALPEILDIDFEDTVPAAILPLQLCRSDGSPVPIPRGAKHGSDGLGLSGERTQA